MEDAGRSRCEVTTSAAEGLNESLEARADDDFFSSESLNWENEEKFFVSILIYKYRNPDQKFCSSRAV